MNEDKIATTKRLYGLLLDLAGMPNMRWKTLEQFANEFEGSAPVSELLDAYLSYCKLRYNVQEERSHILQCIAVERYKLTELDEHGVSLKVAIRTNYYLVFPTTVGNAKLCRHLAKEMGIG